MLSAFPDLTGFLDNVVERAAQNLTIEKLLIQLNLDPSNITFDAIWHRVAEVILANINIANTCALIGATFYGLTFLVPTMVRLRVYGIFSALFFMAYGILAGVISTFLMYFLLLPINSFRLFQITKLLKKARIAVQGDLSIDWLKPFMDSRSYKKGDVLFRKDDAANEMYLTISGKFLVKEIGVELPPGRLLGELGFVSPNNKRTQSVECIEDGTVMTITYDRLLEVYFAYPDFGYFFLRLSSERLLQNIARLEGAVEQYKAQLAQLQAAAAANPAGAR
jgi:Cyclic nucleotide-binding domain